MPWPRRPGATVTVSVRLSAAERVSLAATDTRTCTSPTVSVGATREYRPPAVDFAVATVTQPVAVFFCVVTTRPASCGVTTPVTGAAMPRNAVSNVRPAVTLVALRTCSDTVALVAAAYFDVAAARTRSFHVPVDFGVTLSANEPVEPLLLDTTVVHVEPTRR